MVQSIIKSNEALEFLKLLGLKEPDKLAEIIQHILPQYKQSELIEVPTYKEHLNKIYSFFVNASESDVENLKEKIIDVNIVKSINSLNEESFLPANQVYMNTNELQEYFDGYESAYFVKVEDTGLNDKEFEQLFTSISKQ